MFMSLLLLPFVTRLPTHAGHNEAVSNVKAGIMSDKLRFSRSVSGDVPALHTIQPTQEYDFDEKI